MKKSDIEVYLHWELGWNEFMPYDYEEIVDAVLESAVENKTGGMITVSTEMGNWYTLRYDLVLIEEQQEPNWYMASIHHAVRSRSEDAATNHLLDMINRLKQK